MPPRRLVVYILTTRRNTALYVGVTNNLARRMAEHRDSRGGRGSRFCRRYAVTKLVYMESIEGPRAAIAREKQLKAGSRGRKVALIDRCNPGWLELWPEP